jgi:choline dehydrogenase-like flavoprotein
MGRGPDAVLNPCLKDRGIEGLRLVDAAGLSDVPSAHSNATVIMPAELASDPIRGRPRLVSLVDV